jgi:hypothetical protein
MNLYFVLEGDQTEPKVFPKWIDIVLEGYSQVDFYTDVKHNNFYIFSGGGIPSIYNHTINAIKDINACKLYDKLIVCLDGEEIGVNARIKELLVTINESGIVLNDSCDLEIIVQDVCIESWFLGNRKIVKNNPQNQKLLKYKAFYDVSELDPEKMPNIGEFNTKAQFHFSYLREVFKERNISYSKSHPKEVSNKKYFEELCKRTDETSHLISFKKLRDLLEDIKKQK